MVTEEIMKLKLTVVLTAYVGALLFPGFAKAANHFELTLTDVTKGSSGAKIDIALTEVGAGCEDFTFNNITYVDYSVIVIDSAGVKVEKTPRGRVHSNEDSLIKPAHIQEGHFIPPFILEPFLVKLCPGQIAHEVLDIGKIYSLPPGAYKIRATRNKVSPDVDRVIQSNILAFTFN